jgi:o-succinylbenzoate synthase
MGLRAIYYKYPLYFKFEAGTSRGVLTEKDSYFIRLFDDRSPATFGLGECSPLKGLSIDDLPDFEVYLSEVCEAFSQIKKDIYAWDMSAITSELIGDKFPSIQFGFETALLDFRNGGKRIIFDNAFARGRQSISINGLIWMGKADWMRQQIEQKLKEGYRCIKMKIGALDFEQEYALLESIRTQYTPEQVTLRVDANGAFSPAEAPEKLHRLAQLELHSIEQPIRAGQRSVMAQLCRETPLPIALDEELIGVSEREAKIELLDTVWPQYLILKPSLLGGFAHCREWISLAEEMGIGWWITSALESNVGLNAISQFTAEFDNPLPQGLGTGQLFTNNIDSPLHIEGGHLSYHANQSWNTQAIQMQLEE